jgi:hypothetical protein
VRAEEIEDGQVSRRLANHGAQTIGIEARDGEKTLRARCVRKDPAEGPKSNPGRVPG